MPEQFNVRAYSAQELKYSWTANLLEHADSLLVLHGEFGRSLEQSDGSQVPVTNQSLEFYWQDQAFMISALFDEKGALQEYYGRSLDAAPEINKSEKILEMKLAGSDLQVSKSYKYDIISSIDDNEAESADSDGWLELFFMLERREGPFDRAFLTKYIQLAIMG